jgi:anti-sigma factor RsiW
LGAGGEFEARVRQLESGLFGALAGLAGGLAGSGVALVVGAPAVSNALAWAGVWLVGATGAAMVGASAANGRTSEQHWPA